MWTPSLETLSADESSCTHLQRTLETLSRDGKTRVVTTSACLKHSRDSREGSSLFLFASHNSQARTVRHMQTRPKKQVFSSHPCLLVAATETTVLSSELDGKRASDFRCVHVHVGQVVIEVERVNAAGVVICNVTLKSFRGSERENCAQRVLSTLTGLVLGRAVTACSTQICGLRNSWRKPLCTLQSLYVDHVMPD